MEKIKDFFRNHFWAYLFIGLPVLLFSCFKLYPVIYSFIMSFQKYRPIGSEFIGLANYKEVLTDKVFWQAMTNTVVYTFLTVPVNLFITVIMSIFIFKMSKKSQTLYKSAFYLPGLASAVTTSLVWKLMLFPTENGLFNMIRGFFGFEPISYLGNPDIALYTLIFITYLSASGAGIVLYTASLGSIPNSYYEAADIDAASTWKKFAHITWPLLKPTTLYMLVTQMIASFQVFERILIMTGGGPGRATTTIAFLIYRDAFDFYNFGRASAEAFILAIIIITVSVFQVKWMSTDVEY